jgi:hypothetical protein
VWFRLLVVDDAVLQPGNVRMLTILPPIVFSTCGAPPQGPSDSDLLEVREAMKRQASSIRGCYQSQLAGRVEVKFTIADGVVTGAPTVLQNTTGSGELENCVVEQLASWSFPSDILGTHSIPLLFNESASR